MRLKDEVIDEKKAKIQIQANLIADLKYELDLPQNSQSPKLSRRDSSRRGTPRRKMRKRKPDQIIARKTEVVRKDKKVIDGPSKIMNKKNEKLPDNSATVELNKRKQMRRFKMLKNNQLTNLGSQEKQQ